MRGCMPLCEDLDYVKEELERLNLVGEKSIELATVIVLMAGETDHMTEKDMDIKKIAYVKNENVSE